MHRLIQLIIDLFNPTWIETKMSHSPDDLQNTPNKPGLPLPVAIPQQRPGSKGRGFIAAYAPSLGQCGIDQTTFLHFINDCNGALEGDRWYGAVEMPPLGVTFAPWLVLMGVATTIRAGIAIANKESSTRSKFVSVF